MRTLLSGFFVALVITATATVAPTSYAAQVQTDHWRVTVDESSTMRLDFAIEFDGDPALLSASSPTNTVATSPAASTTANAASTSPTVVESATSSSITAHATSTAPATITSPVTVASTATVATVDTTPSVGVRGDVRITEFVSDPVTGDSEWVELYNMTSKVLMLNDWYVEEGSGKRTVLTGALNPNAYRIVSPIVGSLNNGGDVIRLFDANETLIDDVRYGDTEQSALAEAPVVGDPQSSALVNGAWVATQPTPGTPNPSSTTAAATTATNASTSATGNASSASVSNTSSTGTASDTLDITTNTVSAASTTSSYDTNSDNPTTDASADETVAIVEGTSAESSVPLVDLSRLRTLPLDTEIVTTGIVAVAPGILGKQIFYLAGSGVQVYLHSADFPALARGMRVRVRGVLSQLSGETRVKLADASDIVVLGSGDAPQPHDVTADRIGDQTEGWLVRLTGVFSERAGSDYTLVDDTGSARVTLKDSTGIVPSFAVGDNATVVGIVSETRSGFRVLPRAQDDILVRQTPVDPAVNDDSDLSVPVGAIVEHNDPTSGMAWVLTVVTLLGLLAAALAYHARHRTLVQSHT